MTSDERPGSDDQWSQWCQDKGGQRNSLEIPAAIVAANLAERLRVSSEHWSYDQKFTIQATLLSLSYRAWSPNDLINLIDEILEQP